MQEKERKSHDPGGNNEDALTHDVTIHGAYEQISLPRGATLADLIEELKKKEGFNLKDFTVMLNDRDVQLTEDGTLKENPVLTEKSALTLTKKFVGGN